MDHFNELLLEDTHNFTLLTPLQDIIPLEEIKRGENWSSLEKRNRSELLSRVKSEQNRGEASIEIGASKGTNSTSQLSEQIGQSSKCTQLEP